MKKIVILALAVVASASFCTVDAKKKKKEEKAAEPVVLPVVLNSGSDSVSYAAGMAVTNGLLPFLKQQHGLDSASIGLFLKAFEEVINAGETPEAKARIAGVEIANRCVAVCFPASAASLRILLILSSAICSSAASLTP